MTQRSAASERWPAAHSQLAFTYLDHATLEGHSTLPGARTAMAAVRCAGEPFRFGFDPAELAAYFERHGFKLLDDLTSVDLAARSMHPLGRRPIATRFYHVALATR